VATVFAIYSECGMNTFIDNMYMRNLFKWFSLFIASVNPAWHVYAQFIVTVIAIRFLSPFLAGKVNDAVVPNPRRDICLRQTLISKFAALSILHNFFK
jgi:hypothetical protein